MAGGDRGDEEIGGKAGAGFARIGAAPAFDAVGVHHRNRRLTDRHRVRRAGGNDPALALQRLPPCPGVVREHRFLNARVRWPIRELLEKSVRTRMARIDLVAHGPVCHRRIDRVPRSCRATLARQGGHERADKEHPRREYAAKERTPRGSGAPRSEPRTHGRHVVYKRQRRGELEGYRIGLSNLLKKGRISVIGFGTTRAVGWVQRYDQRILTPDSGFDLCLQIPTLAGNKSVAGATTSGSREPVNPS